MTRRGPSLPGRRLWLEEQRDQALRDLVDLDEQVAAGELRPAEAEPLRRRYERAAAEAITLLDRSLAAQEADVPPVPVRGWRAARVRTVTMTAVALIVALLAVALVLPGTVQQRPAGGFVSGNEALQTPQTSAAPPSPAPGGRDLSKVGDAEMEQLVDANPEVLGMRLALARRYTERGEYARAVPHYIWVLRRDQDNAEALAHLGWVFLQLGMPARAERLIDRSLERNGKVADTWWFKANARLFGASDPQGAIQALRRMQRLRLGREVRQQVQRMLTVAEQKVRDAKR